MADTTWSEMKKNLSELLPVHRYRRCLAVCHLHNARGPESTCGHLWRCENGSLFETPFVAVWLQIANYFIAKCLTNRCLLTGPPPQPTEYYRINQGSYSHNETIFKSCFNKICPIEQIKKKYRKTFLFKNTPLYY